MNKSCCLQMDADWDPSQAEYTSGKKKKKSKFKQMMEKKKPTFDEGIFLFINVDTTILF